MDTFTFTLPAFNDKLIEIKSSNLHGYGMFAACDITRGTIICTEKAMMVLPDYARQRETFYLKQQFLLLSDVQKNIFKSLSHHQKSSDDIECLLDIWQNNQIALKERKSSAIFPLLSRVNHCSKCNAHWVWNDKLSEERLIALKDIEKNSEILVNYCGGPMVSKQRKIELAKRGIDSEPKWCNNDKMDAIIEEYQTLEKSLEKMISAPLEGYKSARRVVAITEKHFDGNARLMHKHCYDAAQFALGLQKWSEASFYLETAMKEKMIAYGEDVDINEDGFMDKVNLLPTKFRSRFRKFDPKYRARLNKSKKVNDDDEKKKESNVEKKKQTKTQTQNGKKSQSKGKNNNKGKPGKGGGNKGKNKQKNNKNKKKRARK